MDRLREIHYPGYLAYESPHHGVVGGLMVETPEGYRVPPSHPEPRHGPGRPGGPQSSAKNRGRSTATATTATSPTNGNW